MNTQYQHMYHIYTDTTSKFPTLAKIFSRNAGSLSIYRPLEVICRY